MPFVITEEGRANQHAPIPAPIPRGTNEEEVVKWCHDWLYLPEKADPRAIARTLCHRLGIDPQGKDCRS